MKRMTDLFDYVFYRIYRFWLKKGDNVPETKGSLILTLIQFFTIMDIVGLIVYFTGFDNIISKLMFAPIALGIGFINHFRYERYFDNNEWPEDKYRESQFVKIRNGWLIALYLLFVLFMPVVYGLLKHNLHLI